MLRLAETRARVEEFLRRNSLARSACHHRLPTSSLAPGDDADAGRVRDRGYRSSLVRVRRTVSTTSTMQALSARVAIAPASARLSTRTRARKARPVRSLARDRSFRSRKKTRTRYPSRRVGRRQMIDFVPFLPRALLTPPPPHPPPRRPPSSPATPRQATRAVTTTAGIPIHIEYCEK